MTYSEFLVDTTAPETGSIKTGPWYDMVCIHFFCQWQFVLITQKKTVCVDLLFYEAIYSMHEVGEDIFFYTYFFYLFIFTMTLCNV